VAASILTAIYHMLRDGTEHCDLGASYLARREADKGATAQRLARRIRALGFQVELRAAA
jgi:transposase